MGVNFSIQNNCQICTASILNSVPICILSRFEEIKSIPSKYLRIILTDENKQMTDNILYCHTKLLYNNTYDKNINKIIAEIENTGFTKGHLFNGVL